MWLCDLWGILSNTLRLVFTVLCFFIIVGPIIFIYGLVTMTTPTTRTNNVKAYNDAGHSWVNGDLLAMSQTSANMATPLTSPTAMTVSATTVEVLGDPEGVEFFQSVFLQSFQAPSTQYVYSVTLAQKGTASNIVGAVSAVTNNVVTDVYCGAEDCAGTDLCLCTFAVMRGKCGGTFTATVAQCSKGIACGTCDQTYYLSAVCFVITKAPNGAWMPSPKKKSCFYPFTSSSNTYKTTSAAVIDARVRADTDPFVVLQDISKGTRSLGTKEAGNVVVGTTLLGLGIGLTAAAGAVCIILLWRMSLERDLFTLTLIDPDAPVDEEEQDEEFTESEDEEGAEEGVSSVSREPVAGVIVGTEPTDEPVKHDPAATTEIVVKDEPFSATGPEEGRGHEHKPDPRVSHPHHDEARAEEDAGVANGGKGDKSVRFQ